MSSKVCVFSGLRRPGRGTVHLLPSSGVKKEWIYRSSPHIPSWRAQYQKMFLWYHDDCITLVLQYKSLFRHSCSFCMQTQTPGNRNATRWTVQIWLRMACTETDCSWSGRRQLCVPWRETSNLTLREIERYNVHMCHWLVGTVMV